jgi:hypothetical protein
MIPKTLYGNPISAFDSHAGGWGPGTLYEKPIWGFDSGIRPPGIGDPIPFSFPYYGFLKYLLSNGSPPAPAGLIWETAFHIGFPDRVPPLTLSPRKSEGRAVR